jgi:threonylcarbamoyladenosine tRNA methylthiotransferase MtaB
MKIRLETLGCRLNTGETERLARQFIAAGHRVVGPDEPFDLCIVNTCTVTQSAARKSRQLIRHLQHSQPEARMVITGCYAQLEPNQAAALGVGMVVSNPDKGRLVELVLAHPDLAASSLEVASDALDLDSLHLYPGAHTRAFLKVQDGCNNACAFCVVRLARGPACSRPMEEVLAEVHELVGLGYREIVLSGVHLGSYGHDLGDRRGLFHLVRRLLREADMPRVRLSSLEPWDLNADFFDLWEDRRLGRHLHLPLQSGCDATLRRMARRTTAAEFASLVAAARAAIPDLSVTTDIMVGFPGETDAEFAASLAFVEALHFAKLHVFRYSPRPGTPAASMPHQVPTEVVAERSQRMHQVSTMMERSFRRRFVGRTMDVLWETGEQHDTNWVWDGLTDNYLRVLAPGGPLLRNTITSTCLVADTDKGLQGEIQPRMASTSVTPGVSPRNCTRR